MSRMPKPDARKHAPSAFQRGCDARWCARPLEECPFPPGAQADDWTAGWHAVDAAMERERQWTK